MYYSHKFQASEGYISWQKVPTGKSWVIKFSPGTG